MRGHDTTPFRGLLGALSSDTGDVIPIVTPEPVVLVE